MIKKDHVQLASSIELAELQKWDNERWQQYLVEPKLDGLRMFVHEWKAYSRNGKPFSFNLNPIISEISRIKGIGDYVLDGELYGGGWEQSMSVGRSTKTRVHLGTTRYYIFDMIKKTDWEKGICKTPFHQRRENLNELVFEREAKCKYVYLHATKIFHPDSYGAFRHVEEWCRAYGYEGVMIKDRTAPYEWKRTKAWLKYKPLLTEDCLIIGMQEGKGKYKGMLGSFLAAVPVYDEDGSLHHWNKFAATNVSGHLTDKMRKDLWKAKNALIGRAVIEVEYRRTSSNGKLIEARFVRFRPDKET